MIKDKHKFSKGYKQCCLFFKEMKMYHKFLEYQMCPEKYVNFKCFRIPTDTKNILDDFGNSSITAFLEYAFGKQIDGSVYSLFKVWLYLFYGEGGSINSYELNYYKKIIDIENKTIDFDSICL